MHFLILLGSVKNYIEVRRKNLMESQKFPWKTFYFFEKESIIIAKVETCRKPYFF